MLDVVTPLEVMCVPVTVVFWGVADIVMVSTLWRVMLGTSLLRKNEILFEITGTLSAHLFTQVYLEQLTEGLRNLRAIYLKDCKYLLKYITHPLVYETLIFLIRLAIVS